MSERKYYNFEEMIKWANFAYFLRDEYPFNKKDLENIKTGWGMLIIPRKGIEDTIKAQLRCDEVLPLKEIHIQREEDFGIDSDKYRLDRLHKRLFECETLIDCFKNNIELLINEENIKHYINIINNNYDKIKIRYDIK